MKFRTNKDNNNYLMVNVRLDFPFLLISRNLNIPSEVVDEINEIYFSATQKGLNEELNIFTFPEEVGIKKDSLVGEYLLNNYDNKNIINMDQYISYNDVVNAFNISVYEDDCKMSNKILKLFKDRSSGFINELKAKYCEEVINYISINRDFDMYIKKKYDNYLPCEYVVYDDCRFISKYLNADNKVKVKKYGD